MNIEQNKRSRGRPSTVDEGRMLDTAMFAYWGDGVEKVSVNEICRRAEVSKPGLYRKFDNEDGLMAAALTQYFKKVLLPLLTDLERATSFRTALEQFYDLVVLDRTAKGIPDGCLVVKMNHSRTHLGPVTAALLDKYKRQIILVYENVVERGKAKGECVLHVPTSLAGAYIYAQVDNAMSQQANGEDERVTVNMLKLAFSVLLQK